MRFSGQQFLNRVCAISLSLLVLFAWSFVVRNAAVAAENAPLRIATFRVDATPPVGSPVAYAPVRKIEDPLFAKGIVIFGAGDPIVLCAVDWIGIGNDGHLIFREKLAEAAGTTAGRVAVHTLHQHDGPRCDFRAEELMQAGGYGGTRFDTPFCRSVIEKVSTAIRGAEARAKPVTHLGVGKAIVHEVASNRRVQGPDGNVILVRYSAGAKNPAAREAPEGLIDPEIKVISFWQDDEPLAVLSYYATHPQSYYGQGDVTSEFVGLARARREQALPGVEHVHFNGAAGNITAGKYNDGSPEMRVTLTVRLAAGMQKAWEATEKTPVHAGMVSWKECEVHLPVARNVDFEAMRTLPMAGLTEAVLHAPRIAWAERDTGDGVPLTISRLQIGKVSILHLPGELFIEYQLAAQQMKPEHTVCVAAYGDYGPCYIGTEISYSQGGYEVGPRTSLVAPEVEGKLMRGIEELLREDP